jgi:hypothetical protein
MAKKSRIITILITSFLLLAALAGCFLVYVSDYYHSDEYAEEIVTDIAKVQQDDPMWVFYPEVDTERNVGFIFYPGGKVEATAYSPLLSSLSGQGITCVLLEMPFNLAVFDINAAEEVYPRFPDIDTWYIGGHSLGGAMASSYADGASKKLTGIILLGAYSVGEESIPTLAIYGSQDQVLDKTKLNSSQPLFMIEGGNHANFGNYGNQKGDGVASISREEQQQETVDSILNFIAETSSK